MYMCFNILTCQDEQGFVCRAYPNSVMYPLTEKQATHKASKQSSSYIGLRPPFGPFPMIDELKQAFFFFGGSSYDNLWFPVSFPNLLLRKRIERLSFLILKYTIVFSSSHDSTSSCDILSCILIRFS